MALSPCARMKSLRIRATIDQAVAQSRDVMPGTLSGTQKAPQVGLAASVKADSALLVAASAIDYQPITV